MPFDLVDQRSIICHNYENSNRGHNFSERAKRLSANQTRHKILLVAKESFLEKGFDGSNIRDIA